VNADKRRITRELRRIDRAYQEAKPGDVVELSMPVASEWIGSGWAVEAD
jgi:hypothetical protein